MNFILKAALGGECMFSLWEIRSCNERLESLLQYGGHVRSVPFKLHAPERERFAAAMKATLVCKL